MFDLTLLEDRALREREAAALLRCNEATAPYGLTLTPRQALELAETRAHALRNAGRLELRGGVAEKIILAFCDSPHLDQRNYAAALNALVEIFYEYKNETIDRLNDDELIGCMRRCFDGPGMGSLELLRGRELERVARNVRYGREPDDDGEEEWDDAD